MTLRAMFAWDGSNREFFDRADFTALSEYGIQFVRRDPYSPTLVRDLFDLVRSKVLAGPEVQPFYFPTFEQTASADSE